jgi:hypothetical protein
MDSIGTASIRNDNPMHRRQPERALSGAMLPWPPYTMSPIALH